MGWLWGSKKQEEPPVQQTSKKKICCACPETKVQLCFATHSISNFDLVARIGQMPHRAVRSRSPC